MATPKVRTCTFDTCHKPAQARGLCPAHYQQQRQGIPLKPLRPNTYGLSLSEKLAFYRDESGGPDACWEWQGTVAGTGYGVLYYDGKLYGAHVLAYVDANGDGDLEDADLVRHSCDNRTCVNPAHLLPGTYADNVQDMIERDRIPRGEQRHNAKLNPAAVRDIRRRFASGEATVYRLAKEYGVNHTAIQQVIEGETWTHIT